MSIIPHQLCNILHTEPRMGSMGTNYAQELSKALQETFGKIDTF